MFTTLDWVDLTEMNLHMLLFFSRYKQHHDGKGDSNMVHITLSEHCMKIGSISTTCISSPIHFYLFNSSHQLSVWSTQLPLQSQASSATANAELSLLMNFATSFYVNLYSHHWCHIHPSYVAKLFSIASATKKYVDPVTVNLMVVNLTIPGQIFFK